MHCDITKTRGSSQSEIPVWEVQSIIRKEARGLMFVSVASRRVFCGCHSED